MGRRVCASRSVSRGQASSPIVGSVGFLEVRGSSGIVLTLVLCSCSVRGSYGLVEFLRGVKVGLALDNVTNSNNRETFAATGARKSILLVVLNTRI